MHIFPEAIVVSKSSQDTVVYFRRDIEKERHSSEGPIIVYLTPEQVYYLRMRLNDITAKDP